MAQRPKVFGIGFHKTGTTSLGVALEQLGYVVCQGARPVRGVLGDATMMQKLRDGDLDPVFQVAEGFQAFRDNPWFCLFRDLDRRFPGSRFVLTEREELSWLDSAVNHFGRTESEFRRWIYGVGSPVGNERVFLERYRRHNREVKEYFADRPDDLLVLSPGRGEGWDELCRHLGLQPPEGPFPHAHQRAYPRGIRHRFRRLRTRWRVRGML